MKIIRYADTPDSPWANGCGSTRLLWSDPAGERRISVAKLEGPATFSALPGMARVLLVLDPIRLTLRVNGAATHLAPHDTLAFSGDDTVELTELDRPGRVLNLMALASRWRPHLSGTEAAFAALVLQDSSHLGVALRSGDLLLEAGPVPRTIGVRFDAVRGTESRG